MTPPVDVTPAPRHATAPSLRSTYSDADRAAKQLASGNGDSKSIQLSGKSARTNAAAQDVSRLLAACATRRSNTS
jgi:hypothetical protein